MTQTSFWLGPVGGLVELPCPDGGVDNTLERFAATQQMLSSRRTVDVFGFRRTWALTFSYLDPDRLAFLEAAYMGMVQGPLRLYDPTRKNLLSGPVSSTLSRRRWNYSGVVFQAVSGSVTATPVAAPSVSNLVPLNTAIRVKSTGDATLVADPDYPTPLISGRTYTLSAWVSVEQGKLSLDADVHGGSKHSTSAITDGQLQRYSVTFTAGQGHSVTPGMTTTGKTVATSIAWQLEEGDHPTQWVPGTGVPPVTIDSMSAQSPWFPLETVGLTIKEL